MFAYCGNNPVMGYDPMGAFDLGGFLTGVAIVVVGAAVIGLTVVTAGAATPLAAVAITSVGTALGVAAIETGASITAAAATDSTAVLDFSYSNGATSTKYGYSAVIDFGNDTAEFYTHTGAMASSSYGCAYGAGLVFNYNDLGDYGGSFVDFSGSTNYRGADYGIDVCWDPSGKGAAAVLGTVGISIPGSTDCSPIIAGYDYYISIGSFSW
jgi:hypothetical protein